MSMARPRQILRRSAEFHQHRHLVDQFARHRPHDMATQHAVGLGVRQNLHEAICRLVRLGAAIGEEQELPRVTSMGSPYACVKRD